MPSALLPCIRNWHTLIKPCAGIFASSKFSNLIHGFACLSVPPSSFGMGSYEATAPDALAQALIRLTEVSSKHLENITITGGIDCAWLAAFAEFALGLRIEILKLDGLQQYCSSSGHTTSGGKIQVTFLKDGAAKHEIEITRKCFILPVGRDLFKMETDTVVQNQVNLIRSSWTSILIDSFGSSAQILLQNPIISGYFGKILVYASQKNTKPYVRSPSGNGNISLKMQYCANSRYGDDLLDFAARRFPELKPVIQTATANRKHRITWRMAQKAVLRLEIACDCIYCSRVGFHVGWCLVHVVSTIVTMISILSMTNVHELNMTTFRAQALCRAGRITYGMQAKYVSTMGIYLHSAAHSLFSALTPTTYHTKRTPIAVAESGICSFQGLLIDPKLPPILAATVTVMPGHIEYSGALVEKIEDLPFHSDDALSEGLLPFELESRKTFELLISETADFNTLQAAYRSQDNSPGIPCHFTVGKIFEALIQSDSLVGEIKYASRILGIDHEEKCVNQGKNNASIPWVQKGQLCVIFASCDLAAQSYVEIHKTSSKFFDQANHHQIYPEYQRLEENLSRRVSPKHNLYIGFTYVSDCPACIVLSFMLGRMTIRDLPDLFGGSCCVTIHRSGQSLDSRRSHTNFEIMIREHVSDKDDMKNPKSNHDDSHEVECENSHVDHHGGHARISHENDPGNNDENSREGNHENSHEDSDEDSDIGFPRTEYIISKKA